eukprot:Nitzschia sp. Nitz4//scaffold345_size17508//8951//11547//NITZ4_008824-RA/size17508-processed-gene-0.12-mRNA-1//1//CDS//3329548631//341//frame0
MAHNSVDVWVQQAVEDDRDNDESTGPERRSLPEQYMDQELEVRYSEDGPEFSGEIVYDGGSQAIPDILLLAHLCSVAHPPRDDTEEAMEDANYSWDPVRDWMRSHSADEVKASAEQRDDAGKTALHFACQNSPPADVVEVILSVAAEVIQWPDTFGWLPIHYACAYGASAQVVKALAEAFPESKTTRDRKGRTPLHFALGTTNGHSPAVIAILCSTGAASYTDDNGMMPLHYACAYGATEDTLYVLTSSYHDAITTTDRRGRTPLHFALSNAGRSSAPASVGLLLNLNRDLVNSHDGGPLPIRVLAEFASTVPRSQQEQRESCKSCLRHLLGADPIPTADFFTALQSLPDYLQEIAVIMRAVQELLNRKIAQRFPTLILMLDFYAQLMVAVLYCTTTLESVDLRFSDETSDDPRIDLAKLYPLYAGASYFLIREIIQVVSLLSLGALRLWIYDPSNWLSIMYVGVIFFWTVNMTTGQLDKDTFRTGAAFCITFISTKFLSYLRNMLIEFAVFTGGVFHVMRRLAAFFLCLVIILVAFSRMFFTIFRHSDYCINDPGKDTTDSELIADLQCEVHDVRPWCDGWNAFISLYTMLVGDVDETKFVEDFTAQMLFVVFMFLVVILLANVLIAIVTDSYKIIQEQRSAIVFWTNRLSFIAQMDAIANGPWRASFRRAVGLKTSIDDGWSPGMSSTFGMVEWKRLMDLYEFDLDGHPLSFENLLYTILRFFTIVVVIPLWIVLGFITAGWLWPPQMREYFFTSTLTKHNSETEREEEIRRTQLSQVRAEIDIMRGELRQELALDRTQVVQTKSLVAERKIEIQNEMRHVKRIVTILFEQQGNI